MAERRCHEEFVYEKLTGLFKHYCHEWDGLAIDETYNEFKYCTCNWQDLTPEETVQLDAIRKGEVEPWHPKTT